jgi:hypothetical protein
MPRRASDPFSDWQIDPALGSCSWAARGLWMEMLGIMSAATPHGHLLIEGVKPSLAQLATLARAKAQDVAMIETLIQELEAATVLDRLDNGTIISRKMIKADARRKKAVAAGKLGGNPHLTSPASVPLTQPLTEPINSEHYHALDDGREKRQKAPRQGRLFEDGGGPEEAEPDLKLQIFGTCRRWLARNCPDLGDTSLRRLLGGWCSRYGDGPTLQAFLAARRESPVEPRAWIEGYLKRRSGHGTGTRTEAQDRADILAGVGLAPDDAGDAEHDGP